MSVCLPAIQGAPVYVRFELVDRDRLEAIRERLLGGSGARPAGGAEQGPAASKAELDVNSPKDWGVEFLRRAMELKEEAARRRETPDTRPQPPKP
jgi:hypothetical protein